MRYNVSMIRYCRDTFRLLRLILPFAKLLLGVLAKGSWQSKTDRLSTLTLLQSVQYAPKTSFNVKFEVPYFQVEGSQLIQGRAIHSSEAGWGNAVLSIKGRFHQVLAEEFKIVHAYNRYPVAEGTAQWLNLPYMSI